jgi:hypothetical protein
MEEKAPRNRGPFFFLMPACCLKNCDRGKKSSFSTLGNWAAWKVMAWRFDCVSNDAGEVEPIAIAHDRHDERRRRWRQ